MLSSIQNFTQLCKRGTYRRGSIDRKAGGCSTRFLHNVPLVSRKLSRSAYQPLQPGSIRVLCLLPGSFDSPLRCRLEHISLETIQKSSKATPLRSPGPPSSSSSEFEAISYAWGPDTQPSCVLHLENSIIFIKESLFRALQHFRYPSSERRLWADAVCINQTDEKEKPEQVNMMHYIFNSAKTVLVWLGAEQGSDIIAFAALGALDGRTNHFKLHPDPSDLNELLQHLAGITHCKCCQSPITCDQWHPEVAVQAFMRLLDRSWFGRMWVIQEVYAASAIKLCAGMHSTDWSNLQCMLSILNHCIMSRKSNKRMLYNLLGSLERIQDLSVVFLPMASSRTNRGESGVPNILDKLSSYSSFGCKDPVDRVFAMRHVLGLNHDKSFDSDYRIQPVDLFRRVVCASLIRARFYGQGYEFLALVGTEEMPFMTTSWVPNFECFTDRSRRKHKSYTAGQYKTLSTFKAGVPEFKAKPLITDVTKLVVRGRVIGRIRKIESQCSWPIDAMNSDQSLLHRVSKVVRWYLRCRLSAAGRLPAGVDLLAFLTRGYSRLGFNQDQYAYAKSLQRTIETALQCYCGSNWATYMRDINELIQAGFLLDCGQAFSDLYVLVDPNQLMCQVRINGRDDIMAWVPGNARVGDHLCVFSGAVYPFVVRESCRSCYRLLGDAYVGGLIAGQVFGTAAADISERPFSDWNYSAIGDDLLRLKTEALIKSMGWMVLM